MITILIYGMANFFHHHISTNLVWNLENILDSAASSDVSKCYVSKVEHPPASGERVDVHVVFDSAALYRKVVKKVPDLKPQIAALIMEADSRVKNVMCSFLTDPS